MNAVMLNAQLSRAAMKLVQMALLCMLLLPGVAMAWTPSGYAGGWFGDSPCAGSVIASNNGSHFSTMGNMSAGAGVGLTSAVYQPSSGTSSCYKGGRSTFRATNVNSASYSAAVTNTDYLYTTLRVDATLAPHGLRLSAVTYNQVDSTQPAPQYPSAPTQGTGARMVIALYDPSTGTLTPLANTAGVVTRGTTNSISIPLTAFPVLLPGIDYELRYYTFDTAGGSGKQVEFDNPSLSAQSRQLFALEKAWVGAIAGASANISVTGSTGGSTPAFSAVAAVAGAPGPITETDIDPSRYDVNTNDNLSISETLSGSGTYSRTLTCTRITETGTSVAVTLGGTDPAARTFQVQGTDRTLTCRYTNQGVGTIKVVKNALPEGSTPFAFTSTIPGTGNTSFNLVDDGNATDTRTMTTVPAGSYTVTESALPAGWNLTNLVCSDSVSTGGVTSTVSGSTATIHLDAGETVTCTYTNTKSATLHIKKTALGGGSAFTFNVTGAATSTFQLNPPANGGDAISTAIFVTPNQNVTIEEPTASFPNGWTLYDVSCANTAGAPVGSSLVTANETIYPNRIGGSITGQLIAGADVTCTFVNTKNIKGTVQKIATGGDATFNYSVFIGSLTPTGTPSTQQPVTTNGGTGIFSQTFPSSGTGTFTIQEANLAGWTLTGATCTQTNPGTGSLSGVTYTPPSGSTGGYVSGTVTAGAEINCVFSNTRLPQVTIAKRTTGGVGTFGFTGGTNGVPATLSLTTTAPNVSANSTPYVVTNVNNPVTLTETTQSSWNFVKWECRTTSGSLTASGSSSTMSIPASALQQGNDLTCTFFNEQKATVRFAKAKVSNDSTSVTASFAAATNLASIPGSITSGTADNSAGTAGSFVTVSTLGAPVTVTENLAGFLLSSATCTDSNSTTSGNPASFPATVAANGQVTIAAANVVSGATLTCTLLNTKQGTITIIKDALPDSGEAFSYSTSGSGLTNFTLSDDGVAPANRQRIFAALAPGVYTVTENALPAGWTRTGLTCSETVVGGDTTSTLDAMATIRLDPGENVTCTFSNSKLPTIQLRKATSGAVGTFTFSGDNGYPGESLTTTNSSGVPIAGAVHTLSTAGVATTLTEAALPTGWTLTDVSCTGLGAGGTAVPTYVNSEDEAGSIVLNAAATAAGSAIVCTFTNTKTALLKIAKVSNGMTGTFAFSSSAGTPNTFNITTATSGTAVEQTLTGLPVGTAITLSELTPATATTPPYYLTGISCANAPAAPVSTFGTPNITNGTTTLGTQTVSLAAGADVTCTFTNQVEGVLTINKQTVGGTGNETFTYDFANAPAGTSPNPATVTTANHSGSVVATVPHTGAISYDVVERAATGFQLTDIQCTSGRPDAVATFQTDVANRKVTISSVPGASKNCTFINVHKPQIRIAKKTVGGTGSFTLSGGTNGLEAANGVVLTTTASTNPVQSPTTYMVTDVTKDASITESIPAGENWLTTWECVNDAQEIRTSGTGTTLTATGAIMSSGGRDLTCTFTNTKQASLKIVKVIRNDNGGTATVAAFNLATSAGALTFDAGAASGADTTYSAQALFVAAGTYTLTESTVTNYLAGTWSCAGTGYRDLVNSPTAGRVTLDAGADVTCTIINDDSNSANLSVSKTDNQTQVVSGTATTYTVMVSNSGPANASGAVFTDTPLNGLQNCKIVSCITTGGAGICPAIGTAVPATGYSHTITNLPAGSTMTLNVQCQVK